MKIEGEIDMSSRIGRLAACTPLLVLWVLGGCSTQLPLVSHAHVGHALTTWHDTPNQQGLMTVAADDLAVAKREAGVACEENDTYTGGRSMQNVVHALVPESQPIGAGSGYGAIRALTASIEHLEYAATSPDASLNLVAAVAQLSIHGETVHERLKVAVKLAQESLAAAPGEWPAYCAQLERELQVAIHGGNTGQDGGGFPSIGFDVLHESLMAALGRENNPEYTPVPRRYVLGLVRLPSGHWEYQMARPDQGGSVFNGGNGY